ncbi:MAG: phospho-N-acetylmuramoyl-pentapeptide-transferase [Oscillospiraceae bacterium]
MNSIWAMILAVLIGFAVSGLLGIVIVPWLHKLKFGQTILDIGPNWHKQKQGTPTMGGIMFIIATLIALAVVLITDAVRGGDIVAGDLILPNSARVKLYGGIIMALTFGIIGFIDDYIKVVKKRNLGLTAMQKTVLQLLTCGGYLSSLALVETPYMFIPFVGNREYWLLPIFYLFGIIVIYATVNAVNFTDGIDGLCASVTMTASVAFCVCAVLQKYMGIGILAAALAGACAGYLIWNWHPAKVMMGDTGSMFLGGLIVAFAFGIDCPLILIPIGIIYVIEGLSDVIQILYFKKTGGKRLFKMAPIHHHFEMSGWGEKKIVIVFSLVNIIGGAIGVALIYFGRV